MTYDDNSMLMHIGGLTQNYLTYIFNQNDDLDKSTDEFDLIKHSPYYPDGNIPKGGSINTGIFNMLSLNCASINAKIDEIIIKLQDIHNNGTEIHA